MNILDKDGSTINIKDLIFDSSGKRKYKMICKGCGKDRGYQRPSKRKLKCKSCGQIGKISGRKGKKLTKSQKDNISRANLKWRTKQNPNYKPDTNNIKRIKHNLRTRLNQAIRGLSKSGSAVSDLGCSIEELKNHLESQFAEGMSWDNYGITGWHIDHIKPLDAFDLEDLEEFKKACHYTNLQPLWAKDNLKKGARYDYIRIREKEKRDIKKHV